MHAILGIGTSQSHNNVLKRCRQTLQKNHEVLIVN